MTQEYCCHNFKEIKEKGVVFDRIELEDTYERKLWKNTIMLISRDYIPLWYCPFCGRLLDNK